MPMPTATMSYSDAERLAERLTRQGASHAVAEHVAVMQAECAVASRLIKALLRQTHPSDVFLRPPEA
jgi:hypothetical protein